MEKIIQIRAKNNDGQYDKLIPNYAKVVENTDSMCNDVIYGVKIDTTNPSPSEAVTYTDDAIGLTPSYMDFSGGQFKWGSWQNEFPFNQIRPCYMVNGDIITYLNPNNFAQDVNGNAIDITSAGAGDVMIEIPKIYYHLYKEGNYQYIKISKKKHAGFCCLAHTYKGSEKDFVYIGAYQATNIANEMRSISGGSGTGSISMNDWRTLAQIKGIGYGQFYWHLLVLLEVLFVVQFKNLNSQAVMGYGWVDSNNFSPCGGLNDKGMNYCASGTANAQMKWLGIEDFWGSRSTWIDGTYVIGTKLMIANVMNSNMFYNGNWANYIEAGDTGLSNTGGYTKTILGSNMSGFTPTNISGFTSTYYSDYANFSSGYVLHFGGNYSDETWAGVFSLYFNFSAGSTAPYLGGRLAYCGD